MALMDQLVGEFVEHHSRLIMRIKRRNDLSLTKSTPDQVLASHRGLSSYCVLTPEHVLTANPVFSRVLSSQPLLQPSPPFVQNSNSGKSPKD